MHKTKHLLQTPFESSSGLTPQFKSYARTFRSEVRKAISSIGGELVSFTRGHFFVSGFFRVGEKFYYFSQSDVRYFPSDRILVRTAQHAKDYTGGVNHFVELGSEMFTRLPA